MSVDPYEDSLDSTLESPANTFTPSNREGSSRPMGPGGVLRFKKLMILSAMAVVLMLVIGLTGFLLANHNDKLTKDSAKKSANYSVSSPSLQGLGMAQLQLGQADQLTINGQLSVNNSLILVPRAQPKTGVTGEIYFDQTTNQPYYYNGTSYVSLSPSAAGVTDLGGSSGSINLGDGLQLIDGQLQLSDSILQAAATVGDSPNLVNSVQGQTGDVSFDGGTGITINGTTVTNTGLLSLGGASGNVTLGRGLAVQGGALRSTVSLSTTSSNLAIVDDGNGNYVITDSASGVGGQVTLAPATVQADNSNSNYSSIHIDKTGSGNFLQFSSNSVNTFAVDQTGKITLGSIDYSQVVGRPATTVTAIAGASGSVTLGNGLGVSGSTLSNTGVTSVTGTANQVIVSSATGNIVVSLPQDLAATSNPTFGNLGLNGTLSVAGNSTLGGNLNITGTSTLTTGTGTATFGGNASIAGATTISGTLSVANATTLSGILGVTGASTFTGLGTFNGGIAIGNNSSFAQTGSGTLSTGTGGVTLNGNVAITGSSSLITGGGTVRFGSLGTGIVQADSSGTLTSGAVDRNSASLLTGNLSVANGGTGTNTFASKGVLYGNGTGSIQSSVAGTASQLLIANALGVPTFTTLSGDGALSNTGSLTINSLQGTGVSLTGLASGQVLQYNGTNIVGGFITNANLQAGTFAGITGTGNLTTGSIGSGFGVISTGNNIATTSALQGATVTATGALAGNSLSVAAGAFAVNASGAITATTGIATSGGYIQTGVNANTFTGDTGFSANITQTGSGMLSTGTGAVSLNGATAVTGSNTFTVGTGATSVGGVLNVTGLATLSNNLTVQGGNVTIGTAGTSNGSLNLTNSTSSRLVSIQGLSPTGTGNATIQIPSIAGGSSDQVCLLNLGNCVGAGSGVTASSSSAGYVPVFTSGNNLTNSIIFQSGTGIGINTPVTTGYALNVQGGDVNFAGTTTVGNGLNVSAGASNFAGNVAVTGANTFSVGTGATTLGGSVGVTGATSLGGTLTVTGASTFNNAVSVSGTNTLTVGTGATTLGGSLAVSGAATFTNAITQSGGGTLSTGTGNVSLNGDTSITGGKSFTQSGNGTFSTGTGAVSFNGVTSVTGTNAFNVGTGATTLGGTLDVTGLASLTGGLTVVGTTNINTSGTANTTIGNSTGSVAITSSGIKISAAGAVSGATTIAASGAISAATTGNTINGLIVNAGALSGVTSIANGGGYTQTGTTANTLSGVTTLTATGTALQVNNSAAINGTATIGTLSVTNNGTINGTLTVAGAGTSSIAGQLSLIGSGLGLNVNNDATIGGTLAVQGSNGITVGNPASVAGVINFANATNSDLSRLIAAAPSGGGNATYTLPSILGNTTDTICLYSLGNCGSAPNTVSTSANGTTNKLAKFTGTQTIGDSSIDDNGTIVTIGATLSAATISTTTIQSAAAMTILPGGNLTIGATNHDLALQGNGSSSFTVTSSGFTAKLGFVAPTANRVINLPNESGTICLQNSTNCGFATGGSGVTSINSLTGTLAIANATGTGSTITIDNASTSQKGIAQFNSTNFSVTSGAVNTIQNIDLSASVQFGNLALGSGGNVTLSNTGVVYANNVTGTGSGDVTIDAAANAIVFKTANGINSFIFPTYGGQGQVICTSGITCATGGGQALILEPATIQTASSNNTAIYVNKASGTGNLMQLQAGGTDALVISASGNTTISGATVIAAASVTGTLTTNTITPTSALTIGATTQSFALQGTGTSTIKATASGVNTTIGFNVGSGGTAPTGSVIYNFQNDNTVTPGTYNVCTTAGNCAGVGGSVTTSGGTPGTLAKFTSGGNIANSLISELSATVTVGGNLSVGTSTNSQLSLGVSGAASGTLVFRNATNSNTTSIVATAPAANISINLPTASGTFAVSASGPLSLDPLTGQLSCTSCLTSGGGGSGGVSSIIGTATGSAAVNGALTLSDAYTSGSTMTINNASTTVKGIASFNSTNFTATSGAINTIQDINTSAAVTFGSLNLQGISGLSLGSTSNVGKISFLDGTGDGFNSAFSVATLTGNQTIAVPNASGTLAIAATGNLSLSALGSLSIANNPSFSTSVTTPILQSAGALSVTANGGTLTVGSSSRPTVINGTSTSNIVVTNGANTTTVNFTAPTANRTISFPNETGTICLQTSATCGFASATNVVNSLNGLNGALSVANATAAGATITLNDASTTQKGIAQFNATNFTATSGIITTVQDINSTATPTFGGVTSNGTVTLNGATSITGTNTLNVGTGTVTFGGAATISGLTSLSGGATISGTTSLTGATTINTTGTANTAIGNNTGTFSLASSGLKVTTAGAVTGVTTLAASGAITAATSGNTINGIVINSGALSAVTGYAQASGNFAISGGGSFDTGTGAVSLKGATTVTGSNTFNVGTGATTLGGTLSVTGDTTLSGNLNVGSSSQFQVNGSNGNITDSGTFNGQTISSASVFTGTVAIQGSNSLALGVAGSVNGSISFANSTSSRVLTLQALTPSGTGNANLQIPSIAGGSTDTVCLQSLGNCAGSGGGITGSGTANYVTKFATGATISNSSIYDDGTFVGINTITNNGKVSIITSGTQTALFAQGAATGSSPVAVLRSGGSTGNLLEIQASNGTTILAKIDSSGNSTAVNGTFNGTLAVIGTSNFTGLITADGGLTSNGNLAVSGTNTLTVGTGAATLGGTLSVAGALSATNTVDVNVNSATALKVRNAGTNVFIVDSTNAKVGIGTTVSSTGGLLQIGGNTTSTTGGLQFGTDASSTLYRSGTNTLTVGGALTVTNDLALANGNLITTQTTANIVNTTATTVNFAGAGTTVNIGAATGTTTIKNDATVTGALGVTGASTFTAGATFNGGVTIANNSSFSQTGSGSFGTGNGAVSLNGATTVTGANPFTVGTGATTLGGSLTVTGATALNNTLTVTAGTGIVGTFSGRVKGANAVNPDEFATLSQVTGAVSGAAGNYIANNTGLQTNGNFNIQALNSGVNGTIGGIIRGAAGGQTVDLLELQASGGGLLARFDASGNLVAPNGTFSGTLGVTGDVAINTNKFTVTAASGNTLIAGTLAVNGTTLSTTATTFNLLNTAATTLNIGGAATTLSVGASTGTTTINNTLAVSGVSSGVGATFTGRVIGAAAVNPGDYATLSQVTGAVSGAAGNYIANSTGIQTSSNFYIQARDSTTNGTIGGIIRGAAGGQTVDLLQFLNTGGTPVATVGADGSLTAQNGTFAGTVNANGGTIATTATTANLFNTNAGTLNIGGAAGSLSLGSSLGTTTIKNSTLQLNGTALTTSSGTFALLNTTATTLNFGGAATTLSVGASTGTTTINNNGVVAGTLAVNGNTLSTTQSSFNLLNTTATTLNFGGAATTLSVGAATGTTTINNNGVVSGTLAVNGGTLSTSASSANLFNTNATTLNIGGAATSINLGAAAGTLNTAGTIATSSSTGNLFNTGVNAVNLGGGATAVNIGSATGTTAINNNLSVAGSLSVAAGQSLTLTGGITATRPSTPIEGTLYYDTTTKQLLVYANAKWQADRTGASTITVGTSAAGGVSNAVASKNPDSADFVNISTNSAQTVINSAIAALPTTGGVVTLLDGVYVVDGSISLPNNVTLVGTGNSTVIKVKNGTNTALNVITNSDTSTGTQVIVKDLRIDGNAANQSTGVMTGILFNGMGAGSGTSARPGARITNVTVRDMYGGYGISIGTSNNNSISDSTIVNNTGSGIYFTAGASYNTITGNTVQGNTGYGIGLTSSDTNNTITGNTVQGTAGYGLYLAAASANNTVSGNTVVASTGYGIALSSSNDNTITGNSVTNSGSSGIFLSTSNHVIVSSNRIYNSGSTTANNGVEIANTATSNTVIGNDITDTSCSTTCYAINISTSNATNNYLSNNRFSVSSADVPSIQDLSTGTVYTNQSTAANGANLITRTANSSTAFSVQNTTGSAILTVDSSASKVIAAALDVTNNANVLGNLSVTGTASVTSTLTVSGSGTSSFADLVKIATVATPTLAGAKLLVTSAEVTTTLRIGDATNGLDINGNSPLVFRGTARPTRRIQLNAEYAGAVLDAGSGANNLAVVTSGYDMTNRMNYYKVTNTQVTNQNYDVVVQVPIPADFDGFAVSNPLRLAAYTSDTTNGTITVQVLDSANANVYSSDCTNQINFGTSTAPGWATPATTNTWTTKNFNFCASGSVPTFTPGDYLTLRIRVQSPTSGNVRIGNIYMDYLSKF